MEMLFDRITHHETAAANSAADKAWLKERYLNSLIQHLETVLNARRYPLTDEQLNRISPQLLDHYGLPDLGQFDPKSQTDRKSLQNCIKELIELYEPRLTQVNVYLSETFDALQINLQFTVEATVRLDDQLILLYFQIDPLNNQTSFKEVL